MSGDRLNGFALVCSGVWAVGRLCDLATWCLGDAVVAWRGCWVVLRGKGRKGGNGRGGSERGQGREVEGMAKEGRDERKGREGKQRE